MPDTPDLPPLPESIAQHFTAQDRNDDGPHSWPPGAVLLGDSEAVAAMLNNVTQPLTAADAAALRHGGLVEAALYNVSPDLDRMRAADQVPLPVEVDVYELLRAGMGLFYAIYYLNAEQTEQLFATLPDQVRDAYVRAGQAFAPNDYRPPQNREDGDAPTPA